MTVSASATPNAQPIRGVLPLRILSSLQEWQTRTFKDVTLSPNDRALVGRLLEDSQGRLIIDEMRYGLRVRARSWVGVVRLETIELRIVPKLAGENIGLVKLLEFTHGIEGLSRFDTTAGVRVAGDSLFDLIALLFAEATERVIRRGLKADYIQDEAALPMVRGRILADRQILERYGQLDRIICRFDELRRDVDENRLLLAVIQTAMRYVDSLSIHRRLARLRAVLEPICSTDDLDLPSIRRELSYDRLNDHYKVAHDLGWVILDALGVEDLLSGGPTTGFAFLLNMNTLFERFIEKLAAVIFDPSKYRVSPQASHSSIIWNALAEKPYSRVVPDLLVERRDNHTMRVAIDAKYKLYDEKRLGSGDVYQAFLYAYAFGSHADAAAPTSLLLYPATSSQYQHHLQVRRLLSSRRAEIIAISIHIPDALEEVTSGTQRPICTGLARVVADLLQERPK